ncbi:MAG: DUF1405 domain-containing protein [Anaerolineales bacterium]|nr:DUF1405 domain-containing protein [Anaerolineales bacterium]MCB9126802.1 DUF1405 domain-containing protein [Ardenticatenales bacterium]MCB9172661.1 DUF1405 domain-containing protein [Ardenticatenales bacterium]
MSQLIDQLRDLSRTVTLRSPWLFWAFIVVNVIGFVLGAFGWYGYQLPQTPLIWWLFVPDCPLVALLFAIALWGLRQGKRWTIFNLWAAVGSIKYGVWTCTVWLAYWAQTGDFNALSLLMFVTHVGLIAQGVVLLLLTEGWTLRQALPAFAYYIFADFVDYRLGHHPMYPNVLSAALVQWHTVAMTWLLGVAISLVGWWHEARPVARANGQALEQR